MTQHDRFLERLAASSEAVFTVAKWLNGRGRAVEIPPTQFAPTASDADAFVDGGDLFIVHKKRVEVKRISRVFTGAADWPFKEIFISNKAAVERSFDHVSGWITVSDDLKAIVIISPASWEHWYLTEVRAQNTGNMETNYACPVAHGVFRRIGTAG